MPQHLPAASNHPLFQPPQQRGAADVTRAAVERSKVASEAAAVTAHVTRSKSRGEGTVVDVKT